MCNMIRAAAELEGAAYAPDVRRIGNMALRLEEIERSVLGLELKKSARTFAAPPPPAKPAEKEKAIAALFAAVKPATGLDVSLEFVGGPRDGHRLDGRLTLEELDNIDGTIIEIPVFPGPTRARYRIDVKQAALVYESGKEG